MAGKSRHNRDDAIVEALARGEGQTAAARLAGCSVSTIRRRMEDADFCQRVERYREQMLDRAAGRIGVVTEKAVFTLEQLMGGDSPPAVRLSAARSIIEFAFKSREILSWEKRLSQLENNVAANRAQGQNY